MKVKRNSGINVKKTKKSTNKEYEKIFKKLITNDGDSESEDDISLQSLSSQKKVFYRDNHIYFHDDVTANSINKLLSIIYEINKKEEENAFKLKMYNIQIPEYYLHICSNGGDADYAFIAYDSIKNSKVKINTIAEGAAISAGSLIYVAGHKKYMRRHSFILIHQLSQFMMGSQTFHDMKDNVESNQKYMNTIKNLYIENCNNRALTNEKLDSILEHDIYWNYEDCVINGLVDSIYEGI